MKFRMGGSNAEKTTPDLRAEIRQLAAAGVRQDLLAKRFGISRTLVNRVINGSFCRSQDSAVTMYQGRAFVYSGTPGPSDLEDVPLGRWT